MKDMEARILTSSGRRETFMYVRQTLMVIASDRLDEVKEGGNIKDKFCVDRV